ncbi:PHP domain-containing protein [Candidatus Woesearchaeota archaeon]|nr:PHP domain-containing protein [Candidatus Woesearchaeota archaeon]
MGFEKLFWDAHVHTTASDALEWSSTQVVARAAVLGLKAIMIADHDTVSGNEEAMAAGENAGVIVVPGIEITSTYTDKVTGPEGMEIHLLGCGVKDFDKLEGRLQPTRDGRRERADRTIALGKEFFGTIFGVEPSELEGHATVTRESIRQSLPDDEEMRSRFMRESSWGHLAYVPYPEGALMTTEKVLDELKPYCECMILAHPGRVIEAYMLRLRDRYIGALAREEGIEYSRTRLDEVEGLMRARMEKGDKDFTRKYASAWSTVLHELTRTSEGTLHSLVRDHGLDGLEVFYSDHSPSTVRRVNKSLSKLRRKFPDRTLLRTLGSDCGHKGKDLATGKAGNLVQYQNKEDCEAFLKAVGYSR